MTSLNFNDPRVYWTSPHPRIDSAGVWSYVSVDDLLIKNAEKFFLINLMDRTIFDFFPAEEIIPAEVLADIKQGKASLLVRNLYHGHHTLVRDVYENFIVKHSVHPKNVLLACESVDMADEIRIVAKEFDLPECRYRWTRLLEWSTRESNREPIKDTLQKKHYEKKFLNFNGNRTWSRSAVVLLFKCLGLIEKGYVSYNSRHTLEELRGLSEETYTTIYNCLAKKDLIKIYPLLPPSEVELPPASIRIGELFEANKEELLKLDQLLVDVMNTFDVMHIGDLDYYRNTYFSVITETSFPGMMFWDRYLDGTLTERGRLLSEKVFKPILAKHPFIMVGHPRTLELLRDIGYKTFHPFIDETYDTIEDHPTRLLAIAEEVKRLCEMSDEEVYTFIDNVLPICEHNQRVFYERRIFSQDIIL